MTGSDVSTVAGEPRRLRGGIAAVWAVAFLVVAGTGAFMLVAVPEPWVNFDGSAYLALASNLSDGAGYVAPDGEAMTARGPGYAAVLALGWLLGGSDPALALAAARIVLFGGALVVFGITHLLTRSVFASTAAAVLYLAQPVLYQAGSSNFVPDGVAVAFVLASLAALIRAFRPPGIASAWMMASGVLLALAYLTKESHALVMIGAVLWIFTLASGLGARLRAIGWMAIGFSIGFVPWAVFGLVVQGQLPGELPAMSGAVAWGLVLLVPATGAALAALPHDRLLAVISIPRWAPSVVSLFVVLALTTRFTGTASDWAQIPRDVFDLVSTEAYRGAAMVALLGLVVLGGLGVWRLPSRDDAWLVVTVLVASLGLVVFVSLAGTVARNLLVTPTLLSVGAGALIAASQRNRPRVVLASVLVLAVIVGSGAATLELSEIVDADRLDAEAPSTQAAAAWIRDSDPQGAFSGNAGAFQSVWRLGMDTNDVELVPTYSESRKRFDQTGSVDRIFWWLSLVPARTRTDAPVAVSAIDDRLALWFEDDLVAILDDGRSIVLSGNLRYPTGLPDGGALALVLDAADAVEPVFVRTYRDAQWVAVLVPRTDQSGTSFQRVVRYHEAEPVLVEGAEYLNLTEYARAVTAVLRKWASEVGG